MISLASARFSSYSRRVRSRNASALSFSLASVSDVRALFAGAYGLAFDEWDRFCPIPLRPVVFQNEGN